jgi:hypothetical protein
VDAPKYLVDGHPFGKVVLRSDFIDELPERLYDCFQYFIFVPLRYELMACTGDLQEFGSRGDELQRRCHFIDGAKSIP